MNLRVGVRRSSTIFQVLLSRSSDRRLAAGFSIFNTESDYDNDAYVFLPPGGRPIGLSFIGGWEVISVNLTEDELENNLFLEI